ncbi:hypothetical protein M422DRAFT_41598 [Sphaerobolus stellatus SS14]|nr:hypothetical protein M422DRAFT_41598 [Sphaerobolus stellatus SS14]
MLSYISSIFVATVVISAANASLSDIATITAEIANGRSRVLSNILGPSSDRTSLEVNVLVGKCGASAFECWKIGPEFIISEQAGTVGARIQELGDMKGATLVFFNKMSFTYAGLHPAPAPQWVTFLAGGGYVTLPATGDRLWIKNGDLIIAKDTSIVSTIGHESTWFPGTVALQLPFYNGIVNHTVLHSGTCRN